MALGGRLLVAPSECVWSFLGAVANFSKRLFFTGVTVTDVTVISVTPVTGG